MNKKIKTLTIIRVILSITTLGYLFYFVLAKKPLNDSSFLIIALLLIGNSLLSVHLKNLKKDID